ncbi:MAG TPA: glycine cleavage T C-terminal barrel domain-containing protein [Tepidisphaeraceae bacterium]|jgi:folate-binding protein YgfZ
MVDASINPVLDLHRQAEGELQPYGDIEIVSTFGEPQAEYAAIRKGCGMMDWPQRGILELAGKDRLSFLNNLLTNQTWNKETKTGLSAGEGVYAFFLNTKGRIIADLNVLERGDRTWLEMDARLVEIVRAAFDKYLFVEQVKMTARVGELHEIALFGPGAADILKQAAGVDVSGLGPLASLPAKLQGTDATIWRDDVTGVEGGYILIVPTDVARALWMHLLRDYGAADQLGKRRLRPVGWAAFNATRIEAGRALYGIDFDESTLPAESGEMDRAVNLTKGCYLGQEIVARMHARGQVAKQLVGFKMLDDSLPLAGAKIFDDQGNEVGGVTSSTPSPMLSNVGIGLGYVKRPFVSPGTIVRIPAEGQLRQALVREKSGILAG